MTSTSLAFSLSIFCWWILTVVDRLCVNVLVSLKIFWVELLKPQVQFFLTVVWRKYLAKSENALELNTKVLNTRLPTYRTETAEFLHTLI